MADIINFDAGDVDRGCGFGPYEFDYTDGVVGTPVINDVEIDFRTDKDGPSALRLSTTDGTITVSDLVVTVPEFEIDIPAGVYFWDVKVYADSSAIGRIWTKCRVNVLGVATYG